jgi:hypothetical protein
MKLIFTLALVITCINVPQISAQTHEQSSPKKVVEEFCRFETTGGRLTSGGWQNGNTFLVRAVPQPQSFSILVTGNNYSVWEPHLTSSSAADVIVGVSGDIWKIDSAMHVTRDPSSQAFKSGIVYRLVLSDKHWELDSDKKTLHEVTGKPAWRIDSTGNTIWLTRDIAIRYLSDLRDKSSSSVFKKDADKAIVLLKRRLQ